MALSRLITSRSPASQCAALPLLWTAEKGLTVGLVTSRETRRWVLPKGWTEPGTPAHVTAAKEALEEAGLIGVVEDSAFGTYTYRKRLHILASVTCEVAIFRLRVSRRLDEWPEKHQRQVAFVSPEEAAARVEEAELADILRSARLAEAEWPDS